MPRTALTVVTTAASGVTLPAAVAVDQPNGNSFVNTGREWIQVTNGSGSPITVTFKANYIYTVGSASYASKDLAVTVPATTTKAYGPFDKQFFNDVATGTVQVDWSSGTTVTALVASLGLS